MTNKMIYFTNLSKMVIEYNRTFIISMVYNIRITWSTYYMLIIKPRLNFTENLIIYYCNFSTHFQISTIRAYQPDKGISVYQRSYTQETASLSFLDVGLYAVMTFRWCIACFSLKNYLFFIKWISLKT